MDNYESTGVSCGGACPLACHPEPLTMGQCPCTPRSRPLSAAGCTSCATTRPSSPASGTGVEGPAALGRRACGCPDWRPTSTAARPPCAPLAAPVRGREGLRVPAPPAAGGWGRMWLGARPVRRALNGLLSQTRTWTAAQLAEALGGQGTGHAAAHRAQVPEN